MAHLLKGRSETSVQPELSVRDRELAILSALLHDTGFLKETGDDTGTGAKYTFVHEKRSCIFASKYLPELGISQSEIEDICSAIRCTGPRNHIGNVSFQREEARQIALLLVTADYLAQMSAADYLDKLPRLYAEFVEAFECEKVPVEERAYQCLDQLLEMTPGFWRNFVIPLLEGDLEGVYHYLSPDGAPNPYLVAVEVNIAELERRLKAKDA
ncbi:MAG: HD domain-containing protein [Luteolibacter sp.]